MADLKAIASIQIGGPKYPSKKRINLYQKEIKKGVIAAELAVFAVFWVCLYTFVQFGVIQPMREAERAEFLYQRMEEQLETMKEANSVMGEVTVEYAHYGSAYQTEEEKLTPDRLVMLDTLKTRIFPLCQSISGMNLADDHMDLTCVLPRGTVLSNLIKEIEADEAVRYVTASVESTPGELDGEQDQRLAADKEVSVSMTVYFKVPEESGKES